MGDPVQSLSKTVHPEVAGPKLQQNRAWCSRGLRDRHPATTRPTARSLPLGARAPGRHGGASTRSRSHSPRTSSARLVDRTAPGATRPWRRQRAPASRPLAGPRPARTLTHSPRDTSSCTSDGPLISCRDRAPAAVTGAREPTAASSQPKGCAPTPRPRWPTTRPPPTPADSARPTPVRRRRTWPPRPLPASGLAARGPVDQIPNKDENFIGVSVLSANRVVRVRT